MKMPNIVPSTCRHCRNYRPEGRRGGTCQLFHAPVQSSWKSCAFATLPFLYLLDQVEEKSPDHPGVSEPAVTLRNSSVEGIKSNIGSDDRIIGNIA